MTSTEVPKPSVPATPSAPTPPPGYVYKLIESRPSTLSELFGSKKFIAMLVGIAITLLSSFGVAVDEGQRQDILNLVMAFIGAQGLADAGKSYAQVKSRTEANKALSA